MEGSYLPFLLRQRRRLIPRRRVRGTEEKAQLGRRAAQTLISVAVPWDFFGTSSAEEGRPLARSLKEEEDEEGI